MQMMRARIYGHVWDLDARFPERRAGLMAQWLTGKSFKTTTAMRPLQRHGAGAGESRGGGLLISRHNPREGKRPSDVAVCLKLREICLACLYMCLCVCVCKCWRAHMGLIMLAELLSAKSEASQLSPGVSSELEAGLITSWGGQGGCCAGGRGE